MVLNIAVIIVISCPSIYKYLLLLLTLQAQLSRDNTSIDYVFAIFVICNLFLTFSNKIGLKNNY